MKLQLISIGKTQKKYLHEGINDYTKRINHYIPFETKIISTARKSGKGISVSEVLKMEESVFLKEVRKGDFIILLDEKGKGYTSTEFATYLQKLFLSGHKRIVFLIGGAWGVSDTLKESSNVRLSLSKMTFSHQLVRLVFLEQLYRAMTILNNEPYHND